jgi:NAD(P)-dependent dehydrogenase (short-subunit alcohol dehydrogenase family)
VSRPTFHRSAGYITPNHLILQARKEADAQDGSGKAALLVNNVWGGHEPAEVFDAMFTCGVRAHYVALAVCAPMLISTPASLAVTVSNAVSADGDGGGAYGMAKLADDRLALTAALQLKQYKVASVAVHPDVLRARAAARNGHCGRN